VLLIFWSQIGADAMIREIIRSIAASTPADFGRITEVGMEWLWRIHGP